MSEIVDLPAYTIVCPDERYRNVWFRTYRDAVTAAQPGDVILYVKGIDTISDGFGDGI